MKTVLLISTKVFHYRVSVYNYMVRRFTEHDWRFVVASDEIQGENQQPLSFDFHKIAFSGPAYRRLIRQVQPDVVLFHMHVRDPFFWSLFHWLKFRRTPVVCWTKGANLDLPDSRLRYCLFNHFHWLSDAILLYSAKQLVYIRGKYHRKVFFANNTLNFDDFPEIPDSKDAIKAEFGIPFKKVALFAGTMGVGGERKKVEHLIRLMHDISDPEVGAVLVGGGMTEQLQSRINRRNTLYLGQIHDARNEKISKLFKAADLFVVPGHVGLGINQAFFWGLPVVTEDGHQPPEIQYLVNERNGFIVPQDDIAALSDKMMLLMRNDSMRAEFSQHAAQDIRATASISNMFHSFLNALSSVIASHPTTQNV